MPKGVYDRKRKRKPGRPKKDGDFFWVSGSSHCGPFPTATKAVSDFHATFDEEPKTGHNAMIVKLIGRFKAVESPLEYTPVE